MRVSKLVQNQYDLNYNGEKVILRLQESGATGGGNLTTHLRTFSGSPCSSYTNDSDFVLNDRESKFTGVLCLAFGRKRLLLTKTAAIVDQKPTGPNPLTRIELTMHRRKE